MRGRLDALALSRLGAARCAALSRLRDGRVRRSARIRFAPSRFAAFAAKPGISARALESELSGAWVLIPDFPAHCREKCVEICKIMLYNCMMCRFLF